MLQVQKYLAGIEIETTVIALVLAFATFLGHDGSVRLLDETVTETTGIVEVIVIVMITAETGTIIAVKKMNTPAVTETVKRMLTQMILDGGETMVNETSEWLPDGNVNIESAHGTGRLANAMMHGMIDMVDGGQSLKNVTVATNVVLAVTGAPEHWMM